MDSSDRSLKRADRPTLGEKLSPETKQTKLNQTPEDEVKPVPKRLDFDAAAEPGPQAVPDKQVDTTPATPAIPVNLPAADTGGSGAEDSLLHKALAKIAELERVVAANTLQTPPKPETTSSPDPSKTPVPTPNTCTSSGTSGGADKDDDKGDDKGDDKDDDKEDGKDDGPPVDGEDMVCMPGGKVVSWMNGFNLQTGALVINGSLGVLCSKLPR